MKNIFFAEFFGTFTLVLIGTGVVANHIIGLVGAGADLWIVGSRDDCLLGDISGAQINPAVTFALALDGSLKWKDAILPTGLAQFSGWHLLLLPILFFIFGSAENGLGATVLSKGVSALQGLVMEGTADLFLDAGRAFSWREGGIKVCAPLL